MPEIPKKTTSLTPYLSIILITLILTVGYITLSPSQTSDSIYELISSPTATPNLISKIKNVFHKSPTTQPTPTATPTPLTPGIGTYNISLGDHLGPTIAKVSFNPLDIQVKDKLTITVQVLANTPADTLTGTLKTDSDIIKLTFKKKSINDKYEIWQTKFKLTSPVLYKYILTLTPSSTEGSSQVIVAPRS